MEIKILSPHLSLQEIQDHRKNCDCILIDHKKLNAPASADSFLVEEESFDIRRQPLRLVAISLHDLNRDWRVINDSFRRNTMIVAADDEVRAHPEIVQFLEMKGVALLMTRRNEKGLLDSAGLLKSLNSLKFKSLLVEDQIDLLPEFTPSA